jgi:hypothetical protein
VLSVFRGKYNRDAPQKIHAYRLLEIKHNTSVPQKRNCLFT